MIQKSLIILKPDAVRRKLVGKIMNRFEENDLEIKALQMVHISKKLAENHYAEHKGKDFYDTLIRFITSGPSIALILEGENAIGCIRALVGATNPNEAKPGSIRGDYKEQPIKSVTENMVHASDSPESAKREITLFFGKKYL
ncbi:MAG: Nucleoside diphosphate kinase [Promethearchaeota archaeon]|nr:MAG: Nucleoside diphosphate kinase [Candidatus Lokiarchaeota archaeon]